MHFSNVSPAPGRVHATHCAAHWHLCLHISLKPFSFCDDLDNWIFTISCAFVVKVLHELDYVALLMFVWIKHAYFFLPPGKGGRGWSWPGSMKTDLLYGVTPDATSVHKVKANSKVQWYSSLYWSISPILPPLTNLIRVLESKPQSDTQFSPFGARLNKPSHYYPQFI